ncbi:toxin-antitoxin system, toxin component [Streptomyces sp. cmx-4-9]|uniref:toxin-antitoxin system, toxin component n=1 Tax=Streptomyces sp. cmx-4-9 TaxID=2790941 RepID=UPI00397F3F73
MRTTQAMRRFGSGLLKEAALTAPADAARIIGSLCAAFGRQSGRPVDHMFTRFPPGTASGLWIDLPDRDLVVVEERARPELQLVIACHELWHAKEGTCDEHSSGLSVAARLAGGDSSVAELLASEAGLSEVVHRAAARAHAVASAEVEAETFGLYLGEKLKPYLPGSQAAAVPEEIRRVHKTLGWGG